MQTQRRKEDQRSTNSCSSNRSLDCSSNCSLNLTTNPNQSQRPHLPRRWETVPLRDQSQKEPVGPGPAPTAGSSMAERCMILKRDECVPLPNKMDQEIASAIDRALFHQKAPAHIWILNAKRNASGMITANTHQNATAAMALIYRDVICTAARTVDKEVIDVEENECWERLKIHTVSIVRYIGKGTEGLQMMRDEMHAENEGVTVPVQVWWLASPHSIKERRQKGEISALSVVFVAKGSTVA
jgi:hypothetical protein